MGEWLQIGPESRRAYLSMPDSRSGPGVLVLHAWWGLTTVFTDICDKLAAQGYAALAPDLFAGNATTDSIAEAEKLVKANSGASEATEASLMAGVDHLRALPGAKESPLGVIGYSLGASWALDLSQARPDDVGAVVLYYGTGEADYSVAKARYLGHFAENDDFEPLDWVQEVETSIRKAGRDVTFHVYPGTGHWFVEPNRPDAFVADATELAWQRTLRFLKDTLA